MLQPGEQEIGTDYHRRSLHPAHSRERCDGQAAFRLWACGTGLRRGARDFGRTEPPHWHPSLTRYDYGVPTQYDTRGKYCGTYTTHPTASNRHPSPHMLGDGRTSLRFILKCSELVKSDTVHRTRAHTVEMVRRTKKNNQLARLNTPCQTAHAGMQKNRDSQTLERLGVPNPKMNCPQI